MPLYWDVECNETGNTDVHRPLIVLVDSSIDTCQMYSSYLTLNGVASISATDGERALELLRTVAPQVLVTALWIPGFGGAGFIERVRAILGNTMPVVVVTGEMRIAEHERALAAGANRILVKPCSPDVLLQELRSLLPVGVLPTPA